MSKKKRVWLAGDRVRVSWGPLRGLEGVFIARKEPKKAAVSFQILHESAAVVLPRKSLALLQSRDAAIREQLTRALAPISAEAIYHLAKHPNEMYHLDPIKFEELVAALLEDAGYEVRITPATRDHGRDILAVLKIPYGEVLTIVDCKRFARHRRIGPELVQRLLWVADNLDRASNAMLVTTSSFTSGAQAIQQEYRWRLRLKEYEDLHEWLCGFGHWHSHRDGNLWLPDEPRGLTEHGPYQQQTEPEVLERRPRRERTRTTSDAIRETTSKD